VVEVPAEEGCIVTTFLSKGPAAVRCAACDVTGGIWVVWGVPMCPNCHAVWTADERFSAGSINDALGLSSSPEIHTADGHKRYCVEAERRTKAWVSERRAKARAA
jgi:hypothetical protein